MSEKTYNVYKEKSNNTNNIIERKQQNGWNKFTGVIEFDVYGKQEIACILMRH